MKKSPVFRTLLRGALLVLALGHGGAWAGPTIEHWTADNGARVYFVESRALPLIDIRVDFAAGSALDPTDQAGLAGLTRSLLATGTDALDEQQIAERIADTGAQFGGAVDNDRAGLTIRTLSSVAERDAAVALAAHLLARPAFPADALARERGRAIAGLREALTRPATLAERAFAAAVYGDHPYGKRSSVESLERIGRDDLLAFHRAHYVAANATVTIVGDASREEAERIALTLTRELPAGAPAAALEQPAQPARTLERIAHPSAQAHILVGLPGLSREDPDYYPLLVGNYILGGGGFVSRLTREVREKRGFAYSVYSYFEPRQVAGPFQIGLQTRGAQADAALQVVEDVLAAFIADGPSDDEMQGARDNIINGFGLRLDSNGKILDHVAMIGFYRLPLDWLDAYPAHIAAVTADAVRDAFARRIRPEHLVTVIAGGDGDAPAGAGAAARNERRGGD
jgi:zinc protease